MVSIINSIDTAHEDMIHDAQMDFYGIRLATCSSDRSVKLFDVNNGQHTQVADLRGHEGPVWQVAWAHPVYGNILASCSYDTKVIIWKETNGVWEKHYEYTGHESSVNSVEWAPHEFGLVLAAASSDGSVSILTHKEGTWEAQKINAHNIGCNAVSWAPAVQPGSLLEPPSTQTQTHVKRIVTGGCDNLAKVWKEENGEWQQECAPLEAHSDWVRDVAWAPSIGLPQSMIATCSQDNRVIIWINDESTGNQWTPKILNTFSDVVWNVSWSITGNILAVSGGDNKVSLWKESLEGQWVCVSNVNKGDGQNPHTQLQMPNQSNEYLMRNYNSLAALKMNSFLKATRTYVSSKCIFVLSMPSFLQADLLTRLSQVSRIEQIMWTELFPSRMGKEKKGFS